MSSDNLYFAAPGVATVRWEPEGRLVLVEWEGWSNSTEFVALLASTDAAGARAVAEHMRASVEALAIDHAASPTSSKATVSLGVATMVPTDATKPEALIAAADEALYESKKVGRNRVSFKAANSDTKLRRSVP